MKAKKHIEFDRVFAYLTEDKTDILWFTNEDEMRRVGHAIMEMLRTDEDQNEKDFQVWKAYRDGKVEFTFVRDMVSQVIRFKSENQMRRAGQCLIDLARIGGNEVEIKTKGPKD